MGKLWIILICCVLYGCNGSAVVEPIPPVVIPAPIVTIEAPTQVNYLGDATISWTCLNVKSIEVTSVSNPLFIGSTKLTGLKETYKFSIKVIGLSNQVLTFDKDITVLPAPIPTKADTLCSKGWVWTDSRSMKIDGSGWHIWKLSQEQLSDVEVFHLDGKYEEFHKDGTRFGNGKWSLSGNKFIWGGMEYTIAVTDSKMVLSYKKQSIDGSNVSVYVDAQDTYVR